MDSSEVGALENQRSGGPSGCMVDSAGTVEYGVLRYHRRRAQRSQWGWTQAAGASALRQGRLLGVVVMLRSASAACVTSTLLLGARASGAG